MPPYGIDSLLNRNFDTQGYFESPEESLYDPAFGNLNYRTAYGPAPFTGNIPLTSYRVEPGLEYLSGDGTLRNLGFEGGIDLPSFGGSSNPRFNTSGKDIEFINAPQDIYPAAVPPNFINAPQNFYPPNLTSTKGLPTLDLQSLPANMGVANEDDVEQVDSLTGEKKSTGIMDLIMSVAVPGYGFFKNMGQGIQGLNQRIQQSDFGRSQTLADYFDARSYGGRDARDRASQQTMQDARDIQTKIDTGRYRRTAADNVIDRGRGERNIPSRAPRGPTGARRGIDSRNRSSIDPAKGRKG